MAARVKAPSSGVGGMSAGNRPWPGITSPDGHVPCRCICSWAYAGRWPFGGMAVKYLNAMCPVRGHRVHAAAAGGE